MKNRIDSIVNVYVTAFAAIFSLFTYEYIRELSNLKELSDFTRISDVLAYGFAAVISVGVSILFRTVILTYLHLSPFRKMLDPRGYFDGLWYGKIEFPSSSEVFIATIRYDRKIKTYELLGEGFDDEGNKVSDFTSSIFEYVRSQDRAIFALDYLRRDENKHDKFLFGIISLGFWGRSNSPEKVRGVVYDSSYNESGQISFSRVPFSQVRKTIGSNYIRSSEEARELALEISKSKGNE